MRSGEEVDRAMQNSAVTTFVTWMLIVSAAASSLLAGRSLMHYFQLESYQFPGYFRTLRRNLTRAVAPGLAMTVYLTALFLVHRTIDRYAGNVLRLVLTVLLLALAMLGGWWCRGVFGNRKAKKPFVVTIGCPTRSPCRAERS